LSAAWLCSAPFVPGRRGAVWNHEWRPKTHKADSDHKRDSCLRSCLAAATAAGDRACIIDASRCLYVTQESKFLQKFSLRTSRVGWTVPTGSLPRQIVPQGRSIIAHRFNGGCPGPRLAQAPPRAKESGAEATVFLRPWRDSGCLPTRVVSPHIPVYRHYGNRMISG
jgi:hypothetical protein